MALRQKVDRFCILSMLKKYGVLGIDIFGANDGILLKEDTYDKLGLGW